ncbi:MAG TPA: hypothetical protein VMU48_14385 [Terracidiphilus sp.]|nr:hypothetical protein [Terracidiphilus sp.]
MQTEAHPLESFFYQAVRNSYEGKLGLNDPELTLYVARMLCEFSEPRNLSKLHEATAHTIEAFEQMVRDSDPVNGTAHSFETERAMRKYIGDSTLFIGGLCLDTAEEGEAVSAGDRAMLEELIRIGKESYFVVSQFDVYEYEREAPLFARLSEQFERCVLGLSLIRKELAAVKAQPPAEA